MLFRSAEYIRDKLIEIDPENETVFIDGCDSYTAKTDALAAYASAELVNKEDATIIVWHPSWAYLLPENVTEEPILKTAQPLTTPSQMMQLEGGTADNPVMVFLSNEREIKGMTEKELNNSGIYVTIVVINPLALNWLSELERAVMIFVEEVSGTI